MEEARCLMELNFFALLAMTQLVVPHMRARHGGMIVNVGSIGGKVVLPWMTLYSVTKYALGALTEGLRMELHGRRHPHHAGLPRLCEDRISAARPRRPGPRNRAEGAPLRHHPAAMRRSHSPRCGARCPHRGHAALGLDSGPRLRLFPAIVRIAHGRHQRNRMNLKLKRTPGIYVVGFMGPANAPSAAVWPTAWAGVSSISMPKSKPPKTSPSPTFSKPAARRNSAASKPPSPPARPLDRARPPAVMALGGGAFAQPANRELLADNGITVWLDCPFETVQRRVAQASHRPLARDPEAFAALYASRRDHYRLADIHVPINSDDPDQAVAAVLSHPLFK